MKLIKTNEDLEQACSVLQSADWVGFDIETTELDPFEGEIRLVQLDDGETTYVADLRGLTDLGPLRDLLSRSIPRKVAHNAKFDAKWARHRLGVELGGIFCTMLASQLIAAGDPHQRHGLADVTLRHLGQVLDKTEQVSDWGREVLDQAQIEYAAKDAAILLPLKDRLWDELVANDLLKVAELENECIVPVLQMELNGFFLDKQLWQDQYDIVNASILGAALKLQTEFAKTYPQPNLFGNCNVNLDSPPQVADALKWAGVPITAGTEEWKIQPLVGQYPVVGLLLDHRGLAKARDSYGPDWFDHINEKTGRIHAEFNQTRAPTGRFGCSNPNLQQIPQESAYRSCFRAEAGNKLVIADYSQVELRILADRSGEPGYVDAFNSGQDFHTMTAAQVFNVPIGEVTADQRSFAKRLNFGVVYGIGASKFSLLAGISKTEAEDFMRQYFETYKTLDLYLRDSGRQAVVDRYSRSGSGRMSKLFFEDDDKWSVLSAKRQGVNMPIQGTSADILKRALRLVHNRCRETEIKLVNIVHDEIILEAPESLAWYASAALKSEMVKAGKEFITKVPVEVEVTIADVWKK